MSVAQPEDVGQRSTRRDRAVIRGAIATGFVRLVTAASSFLTLGIAARFLTKDEFGLVTVLLSLWLILTMFDLGVSGTMSTRVAASHGRDDLAEIRSHVNHALLMLTGIGALMGVAGTVCAVILPWHDWIGDGVSSSTLVRCLIITFVAAGAALPAEVGAMCLNGMQRFATTQLVVAAGSVSALGFTAFAALADPPPEVLILALLGCPLVVSLALTSWVLLGVLRDAGSSRGFELARFTRMLRASWYYALINAGSTISLGTGTVIVGWVLGLAEAAVFNVAIRLFSPIITVIVATGTQLWPTMTEAISRGDVTWARSRYRRGLIFATGISSVASLALVAVGPWVAELWVGPALVPPLSLLVWTAVFTVVIAATSQANVVLMAVERVRAVAALCVWTAIVAVVASIVLTRTIGASGALVGATAACLAFLLPGVALLARRALRDLDPAQTSEPVPWTSPHRRDETEGL